MKVYALVYLDGTQEIVELSTGYAIMRSTIDPSEVKIYNGSQLADRRQNVKRIKLVGEYDLSREINPVVDSGVG